jgi:prolyl oligopeptidase
MHRALGHVIMLGAALASASSWAGDGMTYPETKRGDVVDTLHGIPVPDPYRWLEEDVRTSKDVASWVEAENKVTFGYLEAIPERERIGERLKKLWNYERYSAPFKVGGRYYFTKNTGLQNQSVLYVQDALQAEPRVLIDPNPWSADGTVALAGTSFSEDGRYVAYGVSEGGSDWTKWRVMRIDTGELLPEELRWIKWSGLAWTQDGRGFFYSRFPEPSGEAQYQSVNLNQRLYYHRAGAPQSEDVLVYARPDQPEWNFSPTVTEDGRYLVITVWKGTDRKYKVLVRDLLEPYALPTELVGNFEAEYSFVGNDGPVFYFQTNLDAPRRRLVAIDLRHPDPKDWKELVPQAAETAESFGLVGNQFIGMYLKDAHTQVRLFGMDGKPLREVDLPGIGTAAGFSGRQADTETFYVYASYNAPPSIYHLDLLTGKSELWRKADVDFRSQDYEVRQVFYNSKDGTRVPMFVVARKGLKLDGSHPTLLYGYGGFNISETPWFSVRIAQWLEMGGVYATANLRGGGEYGEEWHQAGVKLKKQNVFDDFIAAAEYLVAQKYTRREKLAIEGGSNGGLLIGAVMTQRPELFGACLPEVGVMDMVRFNQFTAGRTWVDDYGSPENEAEFKALLAYSPYHNLKKGVKYPPTLVTTADTDDRVVPAHSFKFAAALQAAQAGDAPVLIRIETRAGHGGGKPMSKIIETVVDEWAFLVKSLGMKLPAGA